MLVIFLIALFGFILLTVPIAFALFLTALVLGYVMNSWSPALIVQNIFRGIDSFPLMAIPFFLLAGEIMNTGGISSRIVQFSKSLIGHVRGGLGYVTVVASMLISGVSGSAVADTSAIGSILYPVMKEEGYDQKKSVALFAASTTNGPIIPPSIPMVLLGVIANVSVVKLFLGGIIPGCILGLGLMIGWYLHVRKRHNIYKVEGKFNFFAVCKAAFDAVWALFLPFVLLGGIISGVFTPTEAAVVSVVYALIVSIFIYKELKWSDMVNVLVNTVRGTSVVMLVCGAATSAAYFITTAQIPELLAATLISLSGDNWMLFMLFVNIPAPHRGLRHGPDARALDPGPHAHAHGRAVWPRPGVLRGRHDREPVYRTYHAARGERAVRGLRNLEILGGRDQQGHLAEHSDRNHRDFHHYLCSLDRHGHPEPAR